MNQMDSYNPSFFNQTSAHQQFGSSPAHAQPAHGPPPPQFAQGIQPPHHPPFSNGAAAAPAGGFPLASSMGMGSAQASAGGVMMQPAAMQQQSPRVPQSPFTTAPFSTPLQASPQNHQHHFQQPFSKTLSPNRHVSPYAQTPQQQQPFHNQTSQSLSDATQAMAAPVSLPSHSAQHKPQPQGTPAKPTAATPTSPGQLQREREQVTLLLDINRELLQETLRLQEQGKGGLMTNPPPGQDGNKDGDANKQVASKEYIDCMRRLQANLSYLASFADRIQHPNKPVPPGPAIMTIPAQPQALSEMYTKLQSLFPGWKGQLLKPGGAPGQGSPPRPNMQQQQQSPSQG